MKMTTNLFFLMNILLLLSCQLDQQEEKGGNNQKLQKFWISFNDALNNSDVEFLIQNSETKIQCGNCGMNNDSTEWFTSIFFFNNHLERITPPERIKYRITLDIQDVLIEDSKKLHRINYSMGDKEKYNLIYSIIETQGKFKFQGMFTVP